MIYIKDFLKEWLENGRFSKDIEEHQSLTDNNILVNIFKAAQDKS